MEQLSGLKGYLRQLDGHLACPAPHRRRFRNETIRMVEDYRYGHQQATAEDVFAFLGPPEEMAKTYLDTLEPAVVSGYRKRSRLLKRLSVGLLVVAVIVLGGLVYYLETRDLDITITQTTIIYAEKEK